MLMDSIRYLSGADHNYDIAGGTLQQPDDGSHVLRFKATRAFQLPQNMDGSLFCAEIGPNGANMVWDIQKNDVSIGTLTFNDNSGEFKSGYDNLTGALASAAVQFAISDRLEVVVTTVSSADEMYLSFKTLAA